MEEEEEEEKKQKHKAKSTKSMSKLSLSAIFRLRTLNPFRGKSIIKCTVNGYVERFTLKLSYEI